MYIKKFLLQRAGRLRNGNSSVRINYGKWDRLSVSLPDVLKIRLTAQYQALEWMGEEQPLSPEGSRL